MGSMSQLLNHIHFPITPSTLSSLPSLYPAWPEGSWETLLVQGQKYQRVINSGHHLHSKVLGTLEHISWPGRSQGSTLQRYCQPTYMQSLTSSQAQTVWLAERPLLCRHPLLEQHSCLPMIGGKASLTAGWKWELRVLVPHPRKEIVLRFRNPSPTPRPLGRHLYKLGSLFPLAGKRLWGQSRGF
jgi:hypothetical protein